MAQEKFCPVCGNHLEMDTKCCPVCGTVIESMPMQGQAEESTVSVQSQPRIVPVARIQKDEETLIKISKKKSSSRKWIYGMIGIVILGGFMYIGNDTRDEAPIESTVSSNSAASQTKKKVLTASEKTAAEIADYGYSNSEVLATTYGHSEDGFLTILGGEKYKIILIDRKNHRSAVVTLVRKDEIKNFASEKGGLSRINNRLSGVIIAEFAVPNDEQDQDSGAGGWEGTTHRIPIYCSYDMTNSGIIEPGKLTTGKGIRPSHYQMYLFEQKNVDMANLFLMELLPLKESMIQNQIDLF